MSMRRTTQFDGVMLPDLQAAYGVVQGVKEVVTNRYDDLRHYLYKWHRIDLCIIYSVMKHIYIILLPALFLASCADNTGKQPAATTAVEEQSHHSHEEEAIELNSGQKWKVDENMMVYIVHIEKDVTGFGGSTMEEYKQLASGLDKNIEQLTSNCTMEGQAHDELHKWLLPFIELSEQFSASATEEDAAKYYGQIKLSLEDFHRYFE
jgi:hypothetical protein